MSCIHQPAPGQRGFTLIELLTVMAIIGVLAGILIPTVSGVRNSAKRAQTKVRFSQWAGALEQFRQEYGYYPAVTTGDLLNPTAFFAALTGRDYAGTALTGAALDGNTKAVAFYSVSEGELVKDAAGAATDELCDAFGNSEIVVCFDADANGVIKGSELVRRDMRPGNSVEGFRPAVTPEAANFPASGVRAGVLFYSAGRGDQPADLIYSWK